MTEQRKTTKSVKLTERAHERLSEHVREGETLSGAVERALDALDREEGLPDAVTAVLRGDDTEKLYQAGSDEPVGEVPRDE